MHGAAVAEHGDGVADGVELVEPVADVDDRDALVAQCPDDVEEGGHLAWFEGGGGLVHDDHAGVAGHRAGQRDHLLGADSQGVQGLVHIHGDAEVAQGGLRGAVHPAEVDQAEAGARFAAEEEVAGHAHQRDEVDLLVDGRDPGVLGLQRGGEADRAAVVAQLAAVGPVHAGEDLDEGGFPGAVLAHQGVHLPGPQGEVHAVQGEYAGEGLGQAADGEYLGALTGRWAGRWLGKCPRHRQNALPRSDLALSSV